MKKQINIIVKDDTCAYLTDVMLYIVVIYWIGIGMEDVLSL
jgi:hypothetical protein